MCVHLLMLHGYTDCRTVKVELAALESRPGDPKYRSVWSVWSAASLSGRLEWVARTPGQRYPSHCRITLSLHPQIWMRKGLGVITPTTSRAFHMLKLGTIPVVLSLK